MQTFIQSFSISDSLNWVNELLKIDKRFHKHLGVMEVESQKTATINVLCNHHILLDK